MKKCGKSTVDLLLSVFAAFFCAGIAVWAFCQWMKEGDVIILYEVALFGGAAIYAFLHIGGRGFSYDEEKIIFTLSRKDRREFRWDELQKAVENGEIDICYHSLSGVWDFSFPEKKKIREISATKRMAGYTELIAMLKKKNVPAHEADGRVIYDKKWADELFRQVTGEPLYKKDKRNQK
nr:hypothetical protein [uncultured Oscillibacter sp.]